MGSVETPSVEGTAEALEIEEEGDSIGLLIVAIVGIVLLCGLYAFLLYTERSRKEKAKGVKPVN
jgi:hypothetical protein